MALQRRILQRQVLSGRTTPASRRRTTTPSRPAPSLSQNQRLTQISKIDIKKYLNNPDYTITRNTKGLIVKIEAKPLRYRKFKNSKTERRVYGTYIPEIITFNNQGIPTKLITTKPYTSDETKYTVSNKLYNPIVINYDNEGFRTELIKRDAERKRYDSSERKVVKEEVRKFKKGEITGLKEFFYKKPTTPQKKDTIDLKEATPLDLRNKTKILGVSAKLPDGSTQIVSRTGKVTILSPKNKVLKRYQASSPKEVLNFLKEQTKYIKTTTKTAEDRVKDFNYDFLKTYFTKQGYDVKKDSGTDQLVATKGQRKTIVDPLFLGYANVPKTAKVSKSGVYLQERVEKAKYVKDLKEYKKAKKEYEKAIEQQKLINQTSLRMTTQAGTNIYEKLALRQQNFENNYERGVQRYLQSIGIGKQDQSKAKLTKKQLLDMSLGLVLSSNPITFFLGNQYINKNVPKEWRTEFTKSIVRLPFDAVIGMPLTIGGRGAVATTYAVDSVFKRQKPEKLKISGIDYGKELVRTFDIRTPDGIINLAFTVASIRSVAKSKVGEIPLKAKSKIAKALKNSKIERAIVKLTALRKGAIKVVKTGTLRVGKSLIPFKETRIIKNNVVKLKDIQGKNVIIRKTPASRILYKINEVTRKFKLKEPKPTKITKPKIDYPASIKRLVSRPLNKVVRYIPKTYAQQLVRINKFVRETKLTLSKKIKRLKLSQLEKLKLDRAKIKKYIDQLNDIRSKTVNNVDKYSQILRNDIAKQVAGLEKQLKVIDTKINKILGRKSQVSSIKKKLKRLKSSFKNKLKNIIKIKRKSVLEKLQSKRRIISKHIQDLESYRRKIVNEVSLDAQKMRAELVKEISSYDKQLKVIDTKINKILGRKSKISAVKKELNIKGVKKVLSSSYSTLRKRLSNYILKIKRRKLKPNKTLFEKYYREVEILRKPEFYENAYKKLARKKGLKSKSEALSKANKLIKEVEILRTPEFYDIAYKKLLRKKQAKTKGGVTRDQLKKLISEVKIEKKPTTKKPVTREIKTKEGLVLEQVVEQKVKTVTKQKPKKVIILMSQEQFNAFKKLIDDGIKQKSAQIKRSKQLQKQRQLQAQKKKLESMKKQASRSATKQVSKLKQKKGYTTKTRAIVYPITKLDWSQLQVVLQIPRLKVFQKGMQIPKRKLAQQQKRLQKQAQAQEQKQLRKQRQAQKPIQRLKRVQTPRQRELLERRRIQRLKQKKTIKPKQPVKPKLEFEEYAKNKPIDVYVKKRGAKARYVKINAKPLTLASAKNLGRYLVDNLPLASYRLIVSKSKAKKMTFKTKTSTRKFRERKGRTKLPSKTMVERRKYRLDKNLEKKGITLKGLQKLRSQRAIVNTIKKAVKKKR